MANLLDGSRVLGDLVVESLLTSNSLSLITNLGNSSLDITPSGTVKLVKDTNSNVLIGTNTDNGVNKLQINGTITHNGLSLSPGTNIDQIQILTKYLMLTNAWIDTGIDSTDISTGTYILQLYANDAGVGGNNINEYYSGIVSWYSGMPSTNSVLPSDEIVLHRCGGSNGDTGVYLRTYRANTDKIKLQIFSNTNNTSSSNYVFSFRRII